MEDDRREEESHHSDKGRRRICPKSKKKGRKICPKSEKSEKASTRSMQSTSAMTRSMQSTSAMTLMSCKTIESNKKKRKTLMSCKTVESNKQKRKTEITTVVSLPDEIIFFNILVRLPVKSLRRFTSVSKLWCATVGGEDSEFVSAHTLHSKEKPPSILGVFHIKGQGGRSTYTNFINFDPTFFKFSHYLCFGSARGAAKSFSVGYCNGLFCIRSRSGFEITNLTTREVLLVPPTPPMPPGSCDVRYGFGFDSLNDEYKILQLVDGRRCMVFSVSNSSSWTWRELPVPSEVSSILDYYSPPRSNKYCCNYYSDPYNALYSGRFLHWFLVSPEATIMSFDIHTEEFLMILAPQKFPASVPREEYIFLILNGHPCCGYQEIVRGDYISYNIHLFWWLNDPSSNNVNLKWGEQTIALPNVLRFKNQIGITSFLDRLTFYYYDTLKFIMFYHTNSKSLSFVAFPPTFEAFPPGMCPDLLPEPFFIYHKENLLSLKTFMPPGTQDQLRYINQVSVT